MSNIVTTPSHYLVLIVAHTSSTKVNVFEWDGSVTDPSTLHEVDLGDDQMYLISEPGLHDIGTDQIALAVHFAPLVSNMKKFFEARNAPSATIPVHIFLVASGLRHIASDTDAAALLHNSYDIIKSLCPPPYNVGSQATNAIIPSVAVKSAFAWGGLVYCRRLSNERCMSDIPSCRAGGTIAIVPQGDHLLISLEHKDWGTDLPLLSSSHWETGAAALIIRNNMSLDEENLTSEDHLPPVEFAVDGSVRVKSSAMAPSVSPTFLNHSPLTHLEVFARKLRDSRRFIIKFIIIEYKKPTGSRGRSNKSAAAEITSNALKDREIEHSYFGAFASSLLGSSRAAHDIDVILDSSLFLNDDEELDEAGVEAVRDAIQTALQAANCVSSHPIWHQNNHSQVMQHSAVVETVLQDSKSIPKVSEQDMSATKQGCE
ncbi:hypothetical protein C0991_010147 [Blastosporella zonata]|nr:hypothetical protein C0991_010147 [Blastosporella zonata]